MFRFVLINAVMLASVLTACSHRPPRPTPEVEPMLPPQGLIVEQVISGKILGAEIRKPFGLAADFKGSIYLSDAGNDRVIRFTADLVPDRDIGGFGSQAGLFNRPSFLSFDNGLNLTVADVGNRRATRYNTQLIFVDDIPFTDTEDPLKFGYPAGIAFADYGETWIADNEKNQIAIFDNLGRFDRFVGGSGYAGKQLDSPQKILRLYDGSFLVCDAGNSRLVFFDSYGNYLDEMNLPEFQYPIAASEARNLIWVLDGSSGRIFCVDRDGAIFFQAGPSLPGTDTPLKEPSDILFLPKGRLLISDTGNNRLIVCRVFFEEQ